MEYINNCCASKLYSLTPLLWNYIYRKLQSVANILLIKYERYTYNKPHSDDINFSEYIKLSHKCSSPLSPLL